MPSDYVAIKTFIKCDPLLVQLLYTLLNFQRSMHFFYRLPHIKKKVQSITVKTLIENESSTETARKSHLMRSAQILKGGGAKYHTNLDQNDNRWDRMTGQNDQVSKMALVCFGKL